MSINEASQDSLGTVEPEEGSSLQKQQLEAQKLAPYDFTKRSKSQAKRNFLLDLNQKRGRADKAFD